MVSSGILTPPVTPPDAEPRHLLPKLDTATYTILRLLWLASEAF
jgi:hypothetical protein